MSNLSLEQVGGAGIILDRPKEWARKIFFALDVNDATREDYLARISVFLEYINSNGFHHHSFLEFKRYLKERNDWAVASKNKYLASARIFLKELNRQGLLAVDITQNVKSFQQSRKHKKEGLDEQEVALLVEYVRRLPDTPHTMRLRAILSLLLLQGLRQIEVIRLDVKDIDFVNGNALVHGKGRDDKEIVNLHPETVRNIRLYVKSNKIADGALFTSQSNNSRQGRLSTRALRGIVKELFGKVGIEKSVHGTRHFFVTQLVKNYKGDLLEVARYTRHRSLEMLQVYNDGIRQKADLPRFYQTFHGFRFN